MNHLVEAGFAWAAGKALPFQRACSNNVALAIIPSGTFCRGGSYGHGVGLLHYATVNRLVGGHEVLTSEGDNMASSGSVSVTYEDLERLSADLKRRMGDMARVIADCQRDIDQVAGVSWKGDASTAFAQLHAKWQTSAKGIMDSGTGLADFLAKAAPAYRDTDSGLARTLNQ